VKGGGVRADRTIIVIGGFLSVIGLAMAWNGYGYVELERGWSLLIAGTIGFCTGLVLVALGLVLNQLADIAASASRAALMLAKAKPGGGLPEISMSGAAPLASRDEDREENLDVLAKPVKAKLVTIPAAPIPVETNPADSDWEPLWDPEEELERALAAEAHKTGTGEKPAPVAEADDIHENKNERPLAWTVRKDVDDKPAEAAPPGGSKPAPDDDGWLFKTISGPLGGTGRPSPAEGVRVEEPEAETQHEAQAPAHGEESGHGAEKLPDHPAAPADPVTEEAKSEVIGHYEAQGAHYTMYADGSIDAETVHGVYRFASMEELKRFIEGQES
jgi:DNA segregation ATPase FtsK/SpoIIIE-like protein